MAQYSSIAPLPILQQLDKAGELGNYHLLLPHEIMKDPEGYRELFHPDVRKEEMFIILDNSVIELGAAVPPTIMKAAAKVVTPDCVVLPDVLGNAQDTVIASSRAAQKWSTLGLGPFMVVLQGNSIPEIAWCAQQLSLIKGVKYWAVPRIIANTLGTRQTVLALILGAIDDRMSKNIHLLGMSHYFEDDMECCQMPGVMGIDSANPLVLGYNDVDIQETAPPHLSRGDYMESTELTDLMLANVKAVREHVRN